MKSRKVKAAAKSRSFMSKKKLKGNIPLDVASDDPDVDSDSFYYDDIDEFHRKEDEKLSTDDELIQKKEDSSEEEEVLPITDDEKDDWSNAENAGKYEESDSEDKEDEDKDLPNLEAWGKKKSMYYNADFVDEDRGRTYREEDAEAARAEAEEAFAIQKSVLGGISADNLAANLQFEGSAESSEGEEAEDIHDWASVPQKEKLEFLKKSSPELIPFIEDFKEKLIEVKEKVAPLFELVNKGKIASKDCANHIKTKYQLLLHYCMNISCYMFMKSNSSVGFNHPVIQRVASYKKLLDQLNNVNKNIDKELQVILEKLQKNEEIEFEMNETAVNDSKRQKERTAEQSAGENEDMDEDEIEEEGMVDGKRKITYQIAKNKGLIPRRKRENRNPRVKHRMKFRKAKIRRKGQVREVIKERKRYDGEPTGISTHVVKSIKLK